MIASLHAVDAHAHIFSRHAPAVAGARYRPGYEASLEAWQARWAEAGVSHGVVVQPSFFGADNRELVAALAADPTHLRGVAVLDPDVSDEELRLLDRAGVRALRWNLKSVPNYASYATAAWRRLLERAASLGWHLEVFVDHGRLPEIVPALEGTRIAVALDHFANPGLPGRGLESTFKAAEALAADRDVWVKFSGEYRLAGADPRLLAIRWLRLAPDRVVWGSDWPWTGHEAGRDYASLWRDLESWVEPQHLGAVVWDNPARLYGFAVPEGAKRLT